MSVAIDYSKKCIVLITGASRGIGKKIAVDLAKRLKSNSVFHLIARSDSALQETKQEILEINSFIDVKLSTVDLSNPKLEEYESLVTDMLKSVDKTDIEYAICIHNAGTTGDLKNIVSLTDLNSWRKYYDLNLFSVVLLNSVFIKALKPIAQQLIVVNITSLCGRVPFENMGMYGSGKAARELLFRVLAAEEKDLVVLNYSPGPVDTDMFAGIISGAQSEEVRKSFLAVKQTTVLSTEQTVKRLLDILEKGEYKSGDTLDYFDRF